MQFVAVCPCRVLIKSRPGSLRLLAGTGAFCAQALAVFSANGQRDEKLRFAFKVYDMDRDGYISNGELFQVRRRCRPLRGLRPTAWAPSSQVHDPVAFLGWRRELPQVLKMMVGENLKDAQLQQIVDKTIIEGDKDMDGRISFEEFCAMIEGTDIVKQLTLAHI